MSARRRGGRVAAGVPQRRQGGIAGAVVQAAERRKSGRGSGGRAAALVGQWRRNTHTTALLEQKGGSGCDAVLVEQQWGTSGGEG
jgi:hypothetical protein